MQQVDKQLIIKHFSRAAADYDAYAQVQKKMALRLLAAAADTYKKAPRAILEIGCGTGYLTQLLAAAFPESSILATDISEAMLQSAQAKIESCSKVTFRQMDGEELSGIEQYDLIISNAVFQWFTDYPRAFAGFYRHLVPGGRLLYATFGEETFCELQASFAQAYQNNGLALAYQSGPRFLPVQELEAVAEQAGFASSYSEQRYREYFPNVKDFLQSIKKVGANNANRKQARHVSKKVMLDMLNCYQGEFFENQQVYATYHAIFGVSQRRLIPAIR